MEEVRRNDTSFTEKSDWFNLIFSSKYSEEDARNIWLKGIEYGIGIGLHKGRLDGQIVELTNNVTDERHTEFLKKFYRLADEYKCAIQHHPEVGMVVIDTDNENY